MAFIGDGIPEPAFLFFCVYMFVLFVLFFVCELVHFISYSMATNIIAQGEGGGTWCV